MSEEKLPILKPRELIKVAEKLGFVNTRRRGSHFRYVHSDGRKITISVHKGKTIGRGLLRKILRDMDITPENLRKLF